MKLIKKDLKQGLLVLVPESLDDLWVLDKVLEKGDLVSAKTTRKFVSESGKTDRKEVRLKICVEGIEFKSSPGRLHILGTIVEGRPEKFISIGVHHSLEVAPGASLGIKKEWKSYQLEKVNEAVKASKRPKIALVAMDDEEAEVAILSHFNITTKATISSGKSGKLFKSEDKKGKYFQEIVNTLKGSGVNKFIVAGPGFSKDDFKMYCEEKFPEIASQMVVEGIGHAGPTGIREILKRGVPDKVAEESRLAKETVLVEKILGELAKGGLVTYGIKEVEKAVGYGAVSELVVTDHFFQTNRDLAEALLDKANKARAEVHIISSEHEAGRKIDSLGGIVALLRFNVVG